MQYVKFGNTGMDVSRICLGMMSFGKPGKENGVFPWARDYDDAKPLFKKAVDLGINYFDTANVYQMGSSEEITGRLVRDFGLDRKEARGCLSQGKGGTERTRPLRTRCAKGTGCRQVCRGQLAKTARKIKKGNQQCNT